MLAGHKYRAIEIKKCESVLRHVETGNVSERFKLFGIQFADFQLYLFEFVCTELCMARARVWVCTR